MSMPVVDGVQQQAGVTCSATSGASSESEDSSLLAQGKVINVQSGFLGWFLTKTIWNAASKSRKNHPGIERPG